MRQYTCCARAPSVLYQIFCFPKTTLANDIDLHNRRVSFFQDAMDSMLALHMACSYYSWELNDEYDSDILRVVEKTAGVKQPVDPTIESLLFAAVSRAT